MHWINLYREKIDTGKEKKKKKKKKKQEKSEISLYAIASVFIWVGEGNEPCVKSESTRLIGSRMTQPSLSLSLSLRRNIFSTERISRKISLISSLPLYPTYSNDREKNLNTSGQADLLRKFKH